VSAPDPAQTLLAELPRLLRLAERLAPAGIEPEDLVQDVVERAWRSRAGFRGQALASTWLHRILVNRAADLARRGAARGEPAVPLDPSEGGPADAGEVPPWVFELDDPALVAERAENRALLRRALSRLEPADRTAIVLFDGEEMSAAEIGEIIRASPAAVHKRVQRARWRLARELSRGEREPPPRAAGDSCRHALGSAAAYLEGRLEAEERARVDEHLRGCTRCPPIVQALVGLRAALRAPDADAELPPAFVEELLARVNAGPPV
jgi:RNA polymerase sigma factor (sigma-70 family)